MTARQVEEEICKVFARPMGLSIANIEEGFGFSFRFLQRTGAGSRTLCVPSVTESFVWNAKHVSTLAKSGGIIYIQALVSLPGLKKVCIGIEC